MHFLGGFYAVVTPSILCPPAHPFVAVLLFDPSLGAPRAARPLCLSATPLVLVHDFVAGPAVAIAMKTTSNYK